MDALYTDIMRTIAAYGANSILVTIIFLVARSKYYDMMEENKSQCRRLSRIEKSCLRAGIELLDLEDET